MNPAGIASGVSAIVTSTLYQVALYAMGVFVCIYGYRTAKKVFAIIAADSESREDARRSGW